MPSILNTLTREDVLRFMEIITIISGEETSKALREHSTFKGVPPPHRGMTIYALWLGLSRMYNALDPNNIDLHTRKNELDFTNIFFR